MFNLYTQPKSYYYIVSLLTKPIGRHYITEKKGKNIHELISLEDYSLNKLNTNL